MLSLMLILFLVAGGLGSVVLASILRNKPRPMVIVLLHGVFAFIALLLLITYAVTVQTSTLLITSIVVLVLAALGGFTILSIDLRNKPIPKLFAVMHPLIAIIGVVIFIVYLLQ